jgi:hypothetical protein
MTSSREHSHQDSGATLILAIGFVFAVGALCGGLAGIATSSLNNRRTLEIARDREYAADGAIETAISLARAFTSCTPTNGSFPTVTINTVPIRVEYTNACGSVPNSDGVTTYPQRNVIFAACVDLPVGAACAPAAVIIRAQVNFEPASGTVIKTFVQSWNVNR